MEKSVVDELQARRDEIAQAYFDVLPFEPYPVQEEALFAWFSSDQGVLVCAPTGTGKTLIAEAAMFEALKLGKKAYYTTPLIALTDQKYHEMQGSRRRVGVFPGRRWFGDGQSKSQSGRQDFGGGRRDIAQSPVAYRSL